MCLCPLLQWGSNLLAASDIHIRQVGRHAQNLKVTSFAFNCIHIIGWSQGSSRLSHTLLEKALSLNLRPSLWENGLPHNSLTLLESSIWSPCGHSYHQAIVRTIPNILLTLNFKRETMTLIFLSSQEAPRPLCKFVHLFHKCWLCIARHTEKARLCQAPENSVVSFLQEIGACYPYFCLSGVSQMTLLWKRKIWSKMPCYIHLKMQEFFECYSKISSQHTHTYAHTYVNKYTWILLKSIENVNNNHLWIIRLTKHNSIFLIFLKNTYFEQ